MRVRPLLLAVGATAAAAISIACCGRATGATRYEIDLFRDIITSPAEQDSIRNGTSTRNLSPVIQGAIDALGIRGGIIFFPTGRYRIDDTLILPGSHFQGGGSSEPIQLIGSTSFLGGVRDNEGPSDWNGTTFYTGRTDDSLFTFINLNLDRHDRVVIRSGAAGGWITGWKIQGIRFEGAPVSGSLLSMRRKAIKGAYVTHGLIEDCSFLHFNPEFHDGGSDAVIDFSYEGGPHLTSSPYNENLAFNRLKFTDFNGTCIGVGNNLDNLKITDCYAYVAANSLHPDGFVVGNGAGEITLVGGIYTILGVSADHPFVLLRASRMTAIRVESVHCEGPSPIVATGVDCNNVSISNSYFNVDGPWFSLIRVDDKSGLDHQSISLMNNSLVIRDDKVAVPDDLFLTGVPIADFPLGIFAGNVAYRWGSPERYLKLPPLVIGKRLLEVDGVGNTRVSGSVRCGSDDEAASAANAGAIRYRSVGNKSQVEVCMQTGPSTYAWESITSRSW